MKKVCVYAVFMFIVASFLLNICFAQTFPSELNRLRALGQAYMEEEDFKPAIQAYQKAVALAPQSVSDVINLGIANYHGDQNERSIEILNKALTMDSDPVFAHYTLGLAYKKIGDSTRAMQHFKQVVEQDDTDPASLYNYGLSLTQLKRDQEAVPWYEKTIEHDPKHSSAYYQLLLYYSRQGNMKKAIELQKIFRDLKSKEEQRPPDAVDEGKFLGPIEFKISNEDKPRFSSDLKPKFANNNNWSDNINDALNTKNSRVLTLLAEPQIKQSTWVVQAEDGRTSLLSLSDKGSVLNKITMPQGEWRGCVSADYDNDHDLDFFLYGLKNALLLRLEMDNTFTVVGSESKDIDFEGFTKDIKLSLEKEEAYDALWADIDHEGDLDLIVAHPDGDAIYQNNGDGSFSEVSDQFEGLKLNGSKAITVSDLDNDNDLDLLRVTGNNLLEIFSNQRNLKFNKQIEHALPYKIEGDMEGKIPLPKLVCRDFDNDGYMDFTCLGMLPSSVNSQSLVWTVRDNWNLQSLDQFQVSGNLVYLASIFDANNDGYEDLFFSSSMISSNLLNFMVWNRFPLNPQKDMTSVNPNEEQRMGGLLYTFPTDIDFDGDLDLVASTFHQTVFVLENEGGNRNHWLSISVEGNKNAIDGYGSKLLIKDGLYRAKKEITSPITHLGLGEREQVDVIRLTWPNGIFQNIIHQQTDEFIDITEKPGYAGSCPFIYAWNGERFEFIADALSTGPLGLYVGGGYFPPRPEEYVRIRGDQLKSSEGIYELRIREELREITYLDRLELLSVTHPSGTEVHVNERFTIPPFPEFKLIGMSPNARPPQRMTDYHGNDVTKLISKNDNRYPRPWPPSRYEGVGELHWFEIDLNDTKNNDTVMLFMTGYVDWPNSSTARALEQNPSLDFMMPYLQVKNAQGEWQTVRECMGFPAGKLKTVPLDISTVFLTDDRRIRIVSTLQVHWDRILVDTEPILEGLETQIHPIQYADLHYGGYSEGYDLAGNGPHWYDYNHRTSNVRWDYQVGAFTRFGDVLPLLTSFDDMYVIMNHGDEVTVQFDQPAEQKEGQTTTYFLHLQGWVKDADYSTAQGITVEPLPFRGMTAYPYDEEEGYPLDEDKLQYLLKYNTRVFTDRNEAITIPHTVDTPAPKPVSRHETD